VFGVSLAVAIDRSPCHDGIQLPIVVRECIDYVEEFGINQQYYFDRFILFCQPLLEVIRVCMLLFLL